MYLFLRQQIMLALAASVTLPGGVIQVIKAEQSPAGASTGAAQAAQVSGPPAATNAVGPQGLETPWDARRIVSRVVDDTARLKPLIASMSPSTWVQKGAPGAYVLQWQTCQRQLQDVQIVANQLSQNVESLPKALDLYFRLEALELTVRSVAEGAQTYGDRTVANQVMQLAGHSFDSRQRLREYLSDLAETNEANFKVADAEAQRCRGMISREPVPSAKVKSKHK
jgi:hypothetical protein